MTLPAIGVAGCGTMGLPMARQLLDGGFEVLGYDVRPRKEFGAFGEHMQESAAALAARCPIIISVVRDWQQTEDLCLGEDGLFTGDTHPEILVICSTLSPKQVHRLRDMLPVATALIDAPMSGAPYGAEDGTLTFMIGGEATTVQSLMPAFRVMGNEINHLGALGAGMTCKVLNNLLAATSVIAVREVVKAAKALDFPPDKLLEVASASSGATWFGNNMRKISWAKEGYSIVNTIGILEKDVRSLLDATGDFPELRINELGHAIIGELRNLTPMTDD
ncbi:MAG: NAD(P)-dependent oxidoreductase [Sneathiella sp.]